MKEYIINPSELSYICNHCAYLKKNHNLEDKGISVGVTQTLDGMEKDYFLGDTKKIDKSIPSGEVIDPTNDTFFSKILYDNKKRPFRIKGKGDALIKFDDGTAGVIDYKTSKFQAKKGEKNYDKDLQKKINEYAPQLHCYSLMYSNLETDKDFLRKHSRAYKNEESISKSVEKKLEKIKKISITKTSLLGLIFIYPHQILEKDGITIDFSHKFKEVKLSLKKFNKSLTEYFDMLEQKEPPEIPEKCQDPNNRQHCVMHTFFYDYNKLKERNYDKGYE